jgi:hypothetical protein
MCPHPAICVRILVYMCPHTAIYVSASCYICVRLLLYMCPTTAVYASACCYTCVRILQICVCSQTTSTHTCRQSPMLSSMCVSAYCSACVLILLLISPHTATHVSSYGYSCVLILLRMCPHILILLQMCPHTQLMCSHTATHVSSYGYLCSLSDRINAHVDDWVAEVRTLLALPVQKYLLYWYKSTNTDRLRGAAQAPNPVPHGGANSRYSIYLFEWYKRTNTDALSGRARIAHTDVVHALVASSSLPTLPLRNGTYYIYLRDLVYVYRSPIKDLGLHSSHCPHRLLVSAMSYHNVSSYGSGYTCGYTCAPALPMPRLYTRPCTPVYRCLVLLCVCVC